MPRARRHFIPGYIWHITHRCHKKEFLLKFAKDRKRWMHWLFEAKKRYGLTVLNFMITSNHIHLIVVDDDAKDVISRSMQLVASRTAQEYNWRKSSEEFVEMTKEKLGFQVKGRSVSRSSDDYQLREQQAAYSAHFATENASLSDENTCFWSISDVI